MRALVAAGLLWAVASVAAAQTGWIRVPPPAAGPADATWRLGANDYLFGFAGDSGDGIYQPYRSPDGGVTAERIAAAVSAPGYTPNALFADGGVLALTLREPTYRSLRVFLSHDDGATWASAGILGTSSTDDFAVLGDTLVFTTASEDFLDGSGFGPQRVLWSADGGASWVSEFVATNLLGRYQAQFTRGLFVDRGALYTTTELGLFRARSGAREWVRVTDGAIGEGGGIRVWDHAVQNGTAYVTNSFGCGTYLPGVYRRRAGETGWTRLDVEVLLGGFREAACSPFFGFDAAGDTLVRSFQMPSGFELPGVPLSDDGGDTWRYEGTGLPRVPSGGVSVGEVFSANGTLFLTAGDGQSYGLYRLARRGAVATEAVPEVRGVRLWPNPARQALSFSAGEPTTASILDVTGRVVAGPFEIRDVETLDVSAWPAGVYVLRIGGETRRFTVLR